MQITMSRWADFQHYKDRRPPWIKVHRQILDNRHWFALSGDAGKLLVELWLIASETQAGTIDDDLEDLAFRLHRKPAFIAVSLQELEEQDFIEMDDEYASMVLASCTTETEGETEKRESSVSSLRSDTGASPVVENSESEQSDELRGEFAQLVRRHLWQSKEPPAKAWDMGREYSIRDRLIAQGNSPEIINAVYERYRGPPATGKIYWAKNSRPRWEIDKNECLKDQPARVPRGLSTVGDVLSEMGGAA